MSGNTNIDKKEASALDKLIQVLKAQTNGNSTTMALLNEAEKELSFKTKSNIVNCDIQFSCPKYTLRSWLSELRSKGVRAYVHYREINGKTQINITEKSWTVVKNDYGDSQVNQIKANNQKAKQDELENAYREGCDKARKFNITAKDEEQNWVLAEKDGENDTKEEDSNIQFMDGKRESIDWYRSTIDMAAYGQRVGFSMQHYKRCIDRWVSYFSPNKRPIIEQMTANEAASFLSSLTPPDSDYGVV
jgi:hypothetical protein